MHEWSSRYLIFANQIFFSGTVSGWPWVIQFGQVLENTFGIAVATPTESGVFSRPEFGNVA
jgi:hypothetical protein